MLKATADGGMHDLSAYGKLTPKSIKRSDGLDTPKWRLANGVHHIDPVPHALPTEWNTKCKALHVTISSPYARHDSLDSAPHAIGPIPLEWCCFFTTNAGKPERFLKFSKH